MKSRIDVLLVDRGYCETREKAKRIVMAGLVFVDGQRCDKPGGLLDAGDLGGEDGVVDGRGFGVGADIVDGVSEGGEPGTELLLELEAAVVGTDGDALFRRCHIGRKIRRRGGGGKEKALAGAKRFTGGGRGRGH